MLSGSLKKLASSTSRTIEATQALYTALSALPKFPNSQWTYKYPMLKIAISVIFVRALTCRVKITGIGSDAKRTSVKMLIARRGQRRSLCPFR